MISLLLAIPAVVWLFISSLFYAVGEYFSKLWGNDQTIVLTICVAGAYMLSSLTWLPALLHKNQIATMGILWMLFALASTLFLGLYVFDEALTVRQWVGLGFAIVAFLLLIY